MMLWESISFQPRLDTWSFKSQKFKNFASQFLVSAHSVHSCSGPNSYDITCSVIFLTWLIYLGVIFFAYKIEV